MVRVRAKEGSGFSTRMGADLRKADASPHRVGLLRMHVDAHSIAPRIYQRAHVSRS